MLEKEIEIDGNKFYKGRTINENGVTYVEYLNDELQKIKFYEVINDTRVEIIDKENLRNVIKNNYNLEPF